MYRTGVQYARMAQDPKYRELSYDDADCQAFCELVLADLGVRDDSGKKYNWRGSNDMARHAVSWMGTKEDAIKKFGMIPPGAWAFIWENSTGAERARGYTDGKGNYSHIGIYIGDNLVIDSTRYKNSAGGYARNGPGKRSVNAFNRIGLSKCLDFGVESSYNKSDRIVKLLEEIRNNLTELEGVIT